MNPLRLETILRLPVLRLPVLRRIAHCYQGDRNNMAGYFQQPAYPHRS